MTPAKRAALFLALKTIQWLLALATLGVAFAYTNGPHWLWQILLAGATVSAIAAIFVNPINRRQE